MTKTPGLSISGTEVNYEFRMVDIYDLHFFKENPRVATIVAEHRGDVTDEIIDKDLWTRPETHKLKRQIERDGGLIHPLIVYGNEVLEGNTRLCCYRHLHAEKKNSKWGAVKCHVILDKLNKNLIYRLLCSEHIAGKIEWDAYDKANMYRKMKEEDRMRIDQIEALTGDSSTTIYYKIRAYNMMQEYGVIDKDKYSYFEQLVMNSEIREIKKEKDPDIEEKVVKLIKTGTLKKAQDVRKIGTIYSDKVARKKVFKDGMKVDAAYHHVMAKAPMTDSPLMNGIEDIAKRVRELSREDRDAIAVSKRDCSKIHELTKELISLCREMDIKIYIPKSMRKG